MKDHTDRLVILGLLAINSVNRSYDIMFSKELKAQEVDFLRHYNGLMTDFEGMFGEDALHELANFVRAMPYLEIGVCSSDGLYTVIHDLNLAKDPNPETCLPRSDGYTDEALEELKSKL